MSDFVIGELVRVSATFTNGTGSPTDPAAVRFDYKNPEGALTALVYPTDVAIVKESAGIYHVDMNANQAGLWQWYFYSTGTGQAAFKGSFEVEGQWEC